MKQLKPVVASLVMLGLVSGPAFASVHKNTNRTLQQRVTKAQRVIDQNSAVSNISNLNWGNRIFLAGLVNVDGIWGNRFPFHGFNDTGHSTDINVNNANLMVDAKVNSWVYAHMNLAYVGDSVHEAEAWDRATYDYDNNNEENGYQDNTGRLPRGDKTAVHHGNSSLRVDEAYVNIGDFARSPLYGRFGKQYVPFGDYTRYPMVTPLTQMLSQTRATAVVLGLTTDYGLYGNLFAFNGGTQEKNKRNNDTNVRNYGVKLGYYGDLNNIGMEKTSFNTDFSLMRNIYDVDTLSGWSDNNTGFKNRVGGFAGHVDLNNGAFDFYANYVTALKNLHSYSSWKDSYRGKDWGDKESRAWAADVNGDYHFMWKGHRSRAGLSYQWTGQGNLKTADNKRVLFNGIRRRYMADVMTNVWRNTDVGVAFTHNMSYSELKHSSSISNVGVVRLAVQF